MRLSMPRALQVWTLSALAFLGPGLPAFAQAPAPGALVKRLTVDEAVKLALEQNLGIQIERLNPQIQDAAVAQALGYRVPTFSSTLSNSSETTPAQDFLSGGTVVDSTRTNVQLGLAQTLKTGGSYSLLWNNGRNASTSNFSAYNPNVSSYLSFNVSQPLFRNFKIDSQRQTLETARKDRDAADVQLQATILSTTRNVKNAYWDLAFQIDNMKAQQQSLDLAKRLLADNEKRVQIGTMAPIDIVEAQSEVARNEESVIVAEAGIQSAEDRLRALIYNPSTPDFWNVQIEPTEEMAFTAQRVDVDAAVQRAIANRTDVVLAKNSLAKSEINLTYFGNQLLPQVDAQAAYRSSGSGGLPVTQVGQSPITGEPVFLATHPYGAVLGDVFTNTFPTWTFGVTMSYPIGHSVQESNLARAKLQYSQAQTQLKNLELQIATQVRDAGRQVLTNAKRVDSARAARQLAERRLDAEEKKFAAGIQTSFFVFQAQRDLSQARTNEVRATSDYNKSLVEFEAVQETSLGGSAPITSAASGATAGVR
jgi:outer membrane protein TolC